ncbi:MAG: hypothetical protein ACRENE_10865 [Polyangiaceae bacterium]
MRGVDALLAAPVLALAATGCGSSHRDGPRVAWLVVEAAPGETVAAESDTIVALDALRVVAAQGSRGEEPSRVALHTARAGRRVAIGLDAVEATSHPYVVEVPGFCPLPVEPGSLAEGATVRRELVPRIAVRRPAHPFDLGYGSTFALEASLTCGALTSGGRFVWRQVAGPPVAEVRVEGGRFQARTSPAAPDDAAREPAWGIVPVAARATGEVTLEVEWRSRSGEERARTITSIAAASRAHGLPNVAVDEGLLLSGAGWSLEHRPEGASAALERSGDFTRLVPDVGGEWRVRDGAGHALALHAGRYDETPLECGRSSCHAPIAAASIPSPMTEALRSLPAAARSCASPCHATGGKGTHDGGFADVARQLGTVVAETAWEDLPRDMRRSGGVTCLGCHGPGAIPEASARWAILRADVCATCHDAPPEYGHVAAWRSSRMARADAPPATRSRDECARCHTTSGFLAALTGKTDARRAPPESGPIGIACAACHAPHDACVAASPGPLLRKVALPAWARADADATTAAAGASVVCMACHSPARLDPTHAPAASAAILWAGKGGVHPDTALPIASQPVHADGRGCLGCHDGGPPGLERGASHGFRATPAACGQCHAGPSFDAASRDAAVRAEAQTLLDVLARRGGLVGSAAPTGVPHPQSPVLTDDALGRAAYDVLLVLEDPAAASHNEPYARALLDAARRQTAIAGGGR